MLRAAAFFANYRTPRGRLRIVRLYSGSPTGHGLAHASDAVSSILLSVRSLVESCAWELLLSADTVIRTCACRLLFYLASHTGGVVVGGTGASCRCESLLDQA